MQMTLILEDTLIARESQDELIEVLDKIIRERCGIQTKFDIQFVEKKRAIIKKYRPSDRFRSREYRKAYGGSKIGA